MLTAHLPRRMDPRITPNFAKPRGTPDLFTHHISGISVSLGGFPPSHPLARTNRPTASCNKFAWQSVLTHRTTQGYHVHAQAL